MGNNPPNPTVEEEDVDVDEEVVRKVGEKKAVPLLPQDEGAGQKELVIHVPQETAKSAEVGILSTLVILILIACGIAVAYFIYDRKRQQRIKECVDNLQKTEEGKQLTGNKKDKKEAPTPLPFYVDDASTDTQTPTNTTETVTSDETTEADDANNNRDHNTNAMKKQLGRRCCLCFCCPPGALDEPSLEDIWRQKKSKLQKSSDDGTAANSLQVMAMAMKQMEGHHRHHKQPPTVDQTRSTTNRNRRHRNRRGRSQSQPAETKKMSSSSHKSNENRSCWTQAVMPKRSMSLSPRYSKRYNKDSRLHRCGVGHRSRRADVDRKGRSYVQRKPSLEYGRSSSRRPIDFDLDRQHRSRRQIGDGRFQHGKCQSRDAQGQHGRSESHRVLSQLAKDYKYFVRNSSHLSQSESQVRHDCSQRGDEVAYGDNHSYDANHCSKTRHCRGDRRHTQSHHNMRLRDSESNQEDDQKYHDMHQSSSFRNPAHLRTNQIRRRESTTRAKKVQRHQLENPKYRDKRQNPVYCDKEQSQQSFHGKEQSGRITSQDLSDKRLQCSLRSQRSYESHENLTEDSVLCSDGAEYYDWNSLDLGRTQTRFHDPRTGDSENQNQSAYWARPNSKSTPQNPPPPYPHHSKHGYTLIRTIPKTMSRGKSRQSDYDHYPVHYAHRHGHLNISQNYNCEDSDVTPSHIDQSASPSPSGRKRAENGPEDQNDELSDNETSSLKRKVCRKRSGRSRLRKAQTHLMSLSRAVNTKDHQKRDDHKGHHLQDSSTSSENSQERENTVSLAQKLFGLKLSSTKRSKRQQHRQTKSKRRCLRAEENEPLLGGDASWDSEDTTYEASKGTELVDSGYDVSTSFPSEARRSDFTLTHLSPTPARNKLTDETAKFPPANQSHHGGQLKHDGDGTKTEHSPVTFDSDIQESFKPHSSVYETMSNNNSTNVTAVLRAGDACEERGGAVVLKHLGTASSTDLNLGCLGGFSKDDHRELRKLATQQWCEEQLCSSANPPEFKDNEYRDESSSNQSFERNSAAVMSAQGNPELITQRKTGVNADCPKHVSRRRLPYATRVQEAEKLTTEMGHTGFNSTIISSNAVMCSESNHSMTESLQSTDMFDRLARDRFLCREQKGEYLSSESCSACDDPCFIHGASRWPESRKSGTAIRVPNTNETIAYSYLRGRVNSEDAFPKHLRKRLFQMVPRTSPPADYSADRGHLSASILPPDFLRV